MGLLSGVSANVEISTFTDTPERCLAQACEVGCLGRRNGLAEIMRRCWCGSLLRR